MADEPVEPTAEDKPDRREMLAQALEAAETAPAEAPVAEAAPEAAAAAPADEGAVAPAAEPEPLWKRPPASWGKTDHEKWATAASNPEIAPFVQKAWEREEEMRRGVEPLIPKAKFADQVTEALAPFQENIRASGVDQIQAMQSLMVADHNLRNLPPDQKKAYAIGLLTNYGIQLTPDDAYTQAQQPQTYAAPPVNVDALVDRRLSAWEQAREQEVLQAEIDEFKKDRPDFEDLRPYISMLLEKGVVGDLPAAYEKAKRLDDTAFAQLQTAHQAEAEAQRREAADKAAKAAKAAAVSPRSSTPGARPATNAKDRRSVIAEQLDGLTERF